MFYVASSTGGAANTVTVTFTGGTLTSSVDGVALLEYNPGAGLTAVLDGTNARRRQWRDRRIPRARFLSVALGSLSLQACVFITTPA